jgi:hypothetical protein
MTGTLKLTATEALALARTLRYHARSCNSEGLVVTFVSHAKFPAISSVRRAGGSSGTGPVLGAPN